MFEIQKAKVNIGPNTSLKHNLASASLFDILNSEIQVESFNFEGNQGVVDSFSLIGFNFLSSIVIIKDVIIEDKIQIESSFGFLLIKLGSLSIYNFTLKNCFTLGKACLIVDSSDLTIKNSYFLENRGLLASSLYISSSNTTITNSLFSNGSFLSKHKGEGETNMFITDSQVQALEIRVISSSSEKQTIFFNRT